MADDARISTALPRHPKTVKLKRRLQADGCWSLVCLILWVADNRYDGNLQGLTVEDIEIAAGWEGETGAFTSALAEVGFLDGADGSYRVHQWEEHNPWAAHRPERIAASRAAARARWSRAAVSVGCEPDATGIQNGCEPDATGIQNGMPSSPRSPRTPPDEPNTTKNNILAHPLAERDPLSSISVATGKREKAKLELLASGIYTEYPKRVAKGPALTAIKKAIQDVARRSDFDGSAEKAAEWLRARTVVWANSQKHTEKRYIPHPATWFNGARYDDDPTEWNYVVGAGNAERQRSSGTKWVEKGTAMKRLVDPDTGEVIEVRA